MTLRVVLVDDEPLALDRLAFAFRDIAGTSVVGTAANGEEAAAVIAATAPDLVVLDIQMPGRTGLAVAAGLTGADRPEIVFVTAFEHYAPDAFDVEAIDYLIKPVRFERLRQAVERARRRRRERAALDHAPPPPPVPDTAGMIVVTDPRGDRRVAIDAITWIEAARDYVLLHTATHSVMMRATMASLEVELDPARLVRAHRSAIVNLAHVAGLSRNPGGTLIATLRDGTELTVGPSYARELTRRFEGRG